jgi:hypothetical protein
VEDLWREGRRPEDIEKDIENMEPEETVVAPRRLYITADGTIVPTDEGGKEAKVGSVYVYCLFRSETKCPFNYVRVCP